MALQLALTAEDANKNLHKFRGRVQVGADLPTASADASHNGEANAGARACGLAEGLACNCNARGLRRRPPLRLHLLHSGASPAAQQPLSSLAPSPARHPVQAARPWWRCL